MIVRLLRLFCFFLSLSTSVAWAQTITVRGQVSDALGTLPGASVVVKGSERTILVGTVTDMDGNYSLVVNPNDILVFSFVGYESIEVAVEGRSVINVRLQDAASLLSEVVVVGYGVQKRESVVASIAQTTGDELLKTGSATSISQSLQGLMPGVVAVSITGQPGREVANIQIRGVGTWHDSSPLVLVDGIERSMNDIDPNEIETISVLKDASATAVFGVKGGNGVILITTKRGTAGRPVVNFSSNFGFKQPTSKPDFADYVTAMEMWNEAAANDKQWGKIIPESTIEAWRSNLHLAGPYNEYFPNIDWWDEMIKPVGYQQQYNINVRGGSDYMRYFVSLGYLNDGDVFKTEPNEFFDPSFFYKRYNWRTNFDLDITRSTLLTINMAGSQGYRNQNGYRAPNDGELSPGEEGFFSRLYTSASNHFPIKWSDGYFGTGDNGLGNIRADFDLGSRSYKYFDGFLDIKLKQELDFIVEGLTLSGAVSYTPKSGFTSRIQRNEGDRFGDVSQIQYYRLVDYASPNSDGTYNFKINQRWPREDDLIGKAPEATNEVIMAGSYVKNLYYETALNYAATFGSHDVTGLYLFSRREDNFLNPGSTNTMGIIRRQEDHVGRITYGYAGRYLTEMNFAYNGTENFAPGQRFGFFPSVSVGWRISEENFVKQYAGKFLDELKVTYSYGESGNDRIPGNRFAYLQDYVVGGNIPLGYDNRVTWGPLYNEGTAANVNVMWEVSTKRNLGVEFGLFNKITGSVDLYDEFRDRILMDSWTPMWTQQKDATANLGQTKNQGLELMLGWRERVNNDFNYSIRAYAAFNENRIVERNDGFDTPEHLRFAGKPINFETNRIVNGYYESLDDIYNYAVPGNRSTQSFLIPGDLMFIDFNADGIIDANDMVVHRNVTYPLNTYALNLDASYKGWAVSVMFYGVSNLNKNLPGVILWDNWNGNRGVYKASPDVTGRWTPDNATNAVKPALHSDFDSYSKSQSTFTYRNASYIRLKNAEVSYRFGKDVVNRLGMNNLQLYANGNNLITWTKLDKRMDPEVQQAGVHPLVRRMNFGIRASF
jgi:TonB-linked SusC/RagA family outer membrane protein